MQAEEEKKDNEDTPLTCGQWAGFTFVLHPLLCCTTEPEDHFYVADIQ